MPSSTLAPAAPTGGDAPLPAYVGQELVLDIAADLIRDLRRARVWPRPSVRGARPRLTEMLETGGFPPARRVGRRWGIPREAVPELLSLLGLAAEPEEIEHLLRQHAQRAIETV